MVKIRLTRAGAKKRPFYRLIAIDERRQRDGRPLEFLGIYNPVTDPVQVRIDTDRIEAWVKKGAQLSPAVRGLLRRHRTGKTTAPPIPKSPVSAPAAAPAEVTS